MNDKMTLTPPLYLICFVDMFAMFSIKSQPIINPQCRPSVTIEPVYLSRVAHNLYCIIVC